MTATSSRFFDEVAKLMTSATGAAQGVRKELDTLVQTQVERVLKQPQCGEARRVRRGSRQWPRRAARKMSDSKSAWPTLRQSSIRQHLQCEFHTGNIGVEESVMALPPDSSPCNFRPSRI